MDERVFTVCRYLDDGSHEYIQRDVRLAAAVEAFATCVTDTWSARVVVTDLWNRSQLEWNLVSGIARRA